MTTRSKMAGVAAVLLLMTGSALAQNPGMLSPPFYHPMTPANGHTSSFAQAQSTVAHRQAYRTQAGHSVAQNGQRHQNS